MKRVLFAYLVALGCFSTACAGEFNPDLSDASTGMEGTDTDDDTDGGSDTGMDAGTDDGTDTGDGTDGTDTGIPDTCGDGEAQGEEECDGLDLRGAECTAFASPASGNYSGGQLACNDDCTLDFDSCSYCGDGIKNHASEACDGDDMGNLTCEDEGYDGGDLSCDDQCGLVDAACESCEGDENGMYGKAGGDCGGGGGQTGQADGHTFSICLPLCDMDADCVDPDLAICDTVPSCDNGSCHLPCQDDAGCPGGMVCLESYGWCAWEI